MAWEEDFVYPLYLLLIGAGASGGLVALLTHFLEWRRKSREIDVERKRKALEIKVDLVSKITEVYGSLSAKVVVSTERKKPISNIDEAVEKFLGDGDVVHSLLRSYSSSEAGITKRWYDFASNYFEFADATSLYFVSDRTVDEKSQLECNLNNVKNYFPEIGGNFCRTVGGKKEINWDGLDQLRHGFNTDKPYDKELLTKINDLYGDRVSEIITVILEFEIKVF